MEKEKRKGSHKMIHIFPSKLIPIKMNKVNDYISINSKFIYFDLEKEYFSLSEQKYYYLCIGNISNEKLTITCSLSNETFYDLSIQPNTLQLKKEEYGIITLSFIPSLFHEESIDSLVISYKTKTIQENYYGKKNICATFLEIH